METLESKCDSVIALDLIPATGTADLRWDLVSESLQTGNVLSADFDARFLTEYLNYSTDQWNRTNVEKAEILWPEIALLVREGLYLQLPSIFHFAINSPDELSNEEFELRLNGLLAEAWFQAATITAARAQSDSNPDSRPPQQPASAADAKRFLEKAIEFDPSYNEALQLEMPLEQSTSKQ